MTSPVLLPFCKPHSTCPLSTRCNSVCPASLAYTTASFDEPEWNDLTDWVAALAKAHRESKALCYGDFKQVVLTNKQCIWERIAEGERVLIAVNIDDQPYVAHFDHR